MNALLQPRSTRPAQAATAPTTTAATPQHRETAALFQQAMDRAASAADTTAAATQAEECSAQVEAQVEEHHAPPRSRARQRGLRLPPSAAHQPAQHTHEPGRDTTPPRGDDKPTAAEPLPPWPAAHSPLGPGAHTPHAQNATSPAHTGQATADAQRQPLTPLDPTHLGERPAWLAGSARATHWQVQLRLQPPGTPDQPATTLWVQAPGTGASAGTGLQLQLCAPAQQLLAPALQALQQRLAQRGHHLVAQAHAGPDDESNQAGVSNAKDPSTSALDTPAPEPWP
jgi:hypothetical protein